MLARAVLYSLILACAVTPANALTQEELSSKPQATRKSGKTGPGKLRHKNGKKVSVIVDSFGQIKKLQ